MTEGGPRSAEVEPSRRQGSLQMRGLSAFDTEFLSILLSCGASGWGDPSRADSRRVHTDRRAVVALLLASPAATFAGCMPPSWGASALLHPGRRPVTERPSQPFETINVDGVGGVKLAGWRFRASSERRGTIVYLHGVADNRASGIGIASRFVARGFDVISYDSRAHGESTGDACTYGFYEKQDLSRVLDGVAGPVVLLGFSLGGAVALQAAAEDRRIGAVIAVSSFSDLRTVGSERAPFFASKRNVAEAFAIAEKEGRFRADDVSPLAAAARIAVPVLIVHGEGDGETPPAHARRIFAALREPKRLILVPNAGHGGALTPPVWQELDRWLDAIGSLSR
jgi:uncharacterized protein